jgi:hypothetical protein
MVSFLLRNSTYISVIKSVSSNNKNTQNDEYLKYYKNT